MSKMSWARGIQDDHIFGPSLFALRRTYYNHNLLKRVDSVKLLNLGTALSC
jgi:hypothetical protein